MNKAWELIKHLEEGGRIKGINSGNVYDSTTEELPLSSICRVPDSYEMVKPLVKYSIEVWSDDLEAKTNNCRLWDWVGLTRGSKCENTSKFKITVEQIEEIGDE